MDDALGQDLHQRAVPIPDLIEAALKHNQGLLQSLFGVRELSVSVLSGMDVAHRGGSPEGSVVLR